jgi:hypothetical protein
MFLLTCHPRQRDVGKIMVLVTTPNLLDLSDEVGTTARYIRQNVRLQTSTVKI